MTDEEKRARVCENDLFKQLSETAEGMKEKLKQDPGMEQLLPLICSMDIMRTKICDMDSPDPEIAAKGREMFSPLLEKDRKQMTDEEKRARVCENELFNQVTGIAINMQETLKQDPGTERLMALIYSMNVMRTLICDMDSLDPETAAKGREMFSSLLELLEEYKRDADSD